MKVEWCNDLRAPGICESQEPEMPAQSLSNRTHVLCSQKDVNKNLSNALTRRHRLTNKLLSARNGLPLLELLISKFF